jgi:hypothetical protein
MGTNAHTLPDESPSSKRQSANTAPTATGKPRRGSERRSVILGPNLVRDLEVG